VDGIGATVRDMIGEFTSRCVQPGADGQIIRAAERLGLIAAAGELATALGVTPWAAGEARAAAGWALRDWITMRGGTEPAEVRQAIEQVRLFIEQHGDARFESPDGSDARPVANRAGWRKGSGPDREWWVPPQVWKSEICLGLDPTMVAKTLAERGVLRQARDGLQRHRGRRAPTRDRTLVQITRRSTSVTPQPDYPTHQAADHQKRSLSTIDLQGFLPDTRNSAAPMLPGTSPVQASSR
jgi:hypothetical protein